MICALICPYDHPGPLVRFARGLNARTGCCYHKKLISVDSIKVPIFAGRDMSFFRRSITMEILGLDQRLSASNCRAVLP